MQRDRNDYLNFPIGLLKDFLIDSKKVLLSILFYECYTRSEEGKDVARLLDSLEFEIDYELTFVEYGLSISNMSKNQALSGISKQTWMAFYDENKSEKEKVILLAYLALKSILGQSTYGRVTAIFWYSRMAGLNKAVIFYEELPSALQKYTSQHYLQIIRRELEDNWGLVWVLSRGWYMSLKLSYEQLYEKIRYKQEEKKESEKKKNREKKEIRDRINEKLKKSPP